MLVTCLNNKINKHKKLILVKVDGTLTLDENLSDSTGLEITWKAYKTFRKKIGTDNVEVPELDRFTDDQIFFLAFGSVS